MGQHYLSALFSPCSVAVIGASDRPDRRGRHRAEIVKPNSRELMVGVTSNPVFGPVITFGAGGAVDK